MDNSNSKSEHKERVSSADPYRSGTSSFNLDELTSHLTLGTKVLLSLLAVLSALIYLSLYTMIPGFEKVFQDFGAEIPLFSQVFLKIRPLYFICGLLSLLPFLIWLNQPLVLKYKTLIKRFCFKNFVVSIFAYIAVMVSIYLPITTLGEAVG